MAWFKEWKAKHHDLFAYLPSNDIHPHDRFLERTVIRFLPSNFTPNRITLFRLLTTPIVFFLILYGYYEVGAWAFLFVAFTDAIDGSLARTKHMVTKFGMMFDPLADKLLIGSMVLVLVFEYFNFWLGVAILGIEIMFIMTALVSKVKFKTVRAANVWGKIKMMLQVLAVFLTLMALLLDFPVLLSIAAGLFGLAVGFALVSLFSFGI